MSYSPDTIRTHLQDAFSEARDMLTDAQSELDEIEQFISEVENTI